jgi:hypothetical protein
MIIKLFKKIMAKIDSRKFKPTPEEVRAGAAPMDKAEIVEALAKYKQQNPAKYEAKKAALFARYGLSLSEEVEETPDESDKELAALKVKVAKKAK